jgi:hypothetical protein
MDLDYEKYAVIGKTPQTLHEHFRVNPMGASSYPKWIEDRTRELLQRPARLMCDYGHGWAQRGNITDVEWLVRASQGSEFPRKIVLLDGTIIKEWPGNNSDEMA